MAPILSLILIGTSSLTALSHSSLVSKVSVEKSYELIGLNTHTSELLACGGGGSDSERRPTRPGHHQQKTATTVDPSPQQEVKP